MKLQQLSKQLKKEYDRNGQFLYIAPDCIFHKKKQYHCDVMTTNEIKEEYGTFLFEIRTWSDFQDIDIPLHTYLKPYRFINEDYTNQISYTPVYMNQMFTLPKFGTITPQDIYNCTKYFIREVLHTFWIWNIQAQVRYINKEDKLIKYPLYHKDKE